MTWLWLPDEVQLWLTEQWFGRGRCGCPHTCQLTTLTAQTCLKLCERYYGCKHRDQPGSPQSGNPVCSSKGEPRAADSLRRVRSSPFLERSSLLLKGGKAAAGRRVDCVEVARLSEGSSPELLRTSQVRESWDPLLCTASQTADCQPAVTPGSHCILRALCIIALRTAVNLQFLTVASVRDKISAL